MRHGVVKGTVLAAARVLRCSGLFRGGEDPVPAEFSWSGIRRQYGTFRRRRRGDCGRGRRRGDCGQSDQQGTT